MHNNTSQCQKLSWANGGLWPGRPPPGSVSTCRYIVLCPVVAVCDPPSCHSIHLLAIVDELFVESKLNLISSRNRIFVCSVACSTTFQLCSYVLLCFGEQVIFVCSLMNFFWIFSVMHRLFCECVRCQVTNSCLIGHYF